MVVIQEGFCQRYLRTTPKKDEPHFGPQTKNRLYFHDRSKNEKGWDNSLGSNEVNLSQ